MIAPRQEWRQGIVMGSKAAVYPVLHWLLTRADQLRERAYLARFLVRIDVPPEMQDMETNELSEQCNQMMDTFKVCNRDRLRAVVRRCIRGWWRYAAIRRSARTFARISK